MHSRDRCLTRRRYHDGLAKLFLLLIGMCLTSPGSAGLKPPGEDLTVTIHNYSRGGDRVVSARDDLRGLPGGVKEIELEVMPEGQNATLSLRRVVGQSGSALFSGTGTDSITVKGRQSVVILGREMSDRPRNMALEARVENRVKALWLFTVFRVEPKAFFAGNVEEILPDSVLAHAGSGNAPFSAPSLKRTLLSLFKSLTRKHSDLGHKHTISLAYGGIVIRGRILPEGMERIDFNHTHTRTGAFNWKRTISERVYDKNGCLCSWKMMGVKDSQSDDMLDHGEDLLPDSDGTPGELFIWDMDVPYEALTFLFSGKPTLPEGEIQRVRIQFFQQAYYAGVPVSESIPWYWRSSQENPLGKDKFMQNSDYAEDNKLKANAITPLTFDLRSSVVPDFTVTGFYPATLELGKTFHGEVKGVGLDAGAPCRPMVHLIKERFDDTEAFKTVIGFNVRSVSPTRLAGSFEVPEDAPEGAYQVKVFIGDKVQTGPHPVTILVKGNRFE